MADTWKSVLAIGLLATAAAARADVRIGFQDIIQFDDIPLGSTQFAADTQIPTTVFGGTGIVASTPEHPALSGDRLIGGTTIGFTVGPARENLRDYSWPAVGGYVTGSAAILLTLFCYDANADAEYQCGPTYGVGGGTTNAYLATDALAFGPGLFVSATFTSDAYFTLDDLTLGLPDVAPGIPEPAAWTMMLIGFGTAGSMLRQRRLAGTFALA